jgi:hypothetical protein
MEDSPKTEFKLNIDLRNYIAGQAMAGLIATTYFDTEPEHRERLFIRAFAIADDYLNYLETEEING